MPNPTSLEPFIAAAVAHNPRAMMRMEGYIRGRHGEMLVAARKSGFFDHRIITMGRAEHAVSARLALGFLETEEENSRILRVFRAGWPEAMKAAEQEQQPSIALVSRHSTELHSTDLPVMFELAVFYLACSMLEKRPISPNMQEMDRKILSSLYDWMLATEKIGENGVEEMLKGRSFPKKRRELFDTGSMITSPGDLNELPVILDYAQSIAGIDAEAYTDGMILSSQELDALTLGAKGREDARIGAFVALILKAAHKDRDFILQSDDETPRARFLEAEQQARELSIRLDDALEEIASLRAQLDAAKAREARRDQASAAQAADVEELASLRDALYRMDAQNGTDDIPSEKASRGIPDRLVSIGGLPAWRAEMSRRIPSARFIPADVSLPEDTIRAASELWVEPSYLGHSAFYRAVAVAKAAGVPVRYWPGRNVEICMQAVQAAKGGSR